MRFLFIGLGGIGQRHVRNVRALFGTQVELTTVRSRGQTHILTDRMEIEAANGLYEKYGIREIATLEDAFQEHPDAVFICNPTSQHLAVALQAAQADCNLFIEKPLAHTLDGVSQLISLLRAHRRVGMVGYQMRFHPCLQRVKELLDEHAIGPLVAVRAQVGEYLPDWHKYEDYRGTYGARSELGGGALLSQIHEFDYLYWFFGMPQRVFTLGGHLSHLDVDVEDVASTLMQFQQQGSWFPAHLQQDYVQRPPARTLELVGDRGKILMNLVTLSVQHFDASGGLASVNEFPDFQRNQLFLRELEHFVACLKAQAEPVVSIQDGAQSLRIALAAKASMQSGSVVNLNSEFTV